MFNGVVDTPKNIPLDEPMTREGFPELALGLAYAMEVCGPIGPKSITMVLFDGHEAVRLINLVDEPSLAEQICFGATHKRR